MDKAQAEKENRYYALKAIILTLGELGDISAEDVNKVMLEIIADSGSLFAELERGDFVEENN